MVVLGWLACGLLAWTGWQRQRNQERLGFTRLVANAEASLQQRMTTYTDELRAGAAFMRASHVVDRGEWREFAATIDVMRRYPGIRGIGVIFPVPTENTAAFLRATRADGAPDFTIHGPPGGDPPGPEMGVITYIEPAAENGPAFGLDVLREAHRREAALRSRDTGEPTMTRRISLVQVETEKPGSLLFVPVYRAGKNPTTIAERRANHTAWVYAPLVLEELVTGSLGVREGRVRLQVFEGREITPAAVVYNPDGATVRHFERVSRLVLAGQTFTIGWTRGPEFLPAPVSLLTWGGVAGAVAVLLVAGLVFSVQLTGWRAQQIADRTQSVLKTTTRMLPGMVAYWTSDLRCAFSNTAYVEWFGFRPQDMVNMRMQDLLGPALFEKNRPYVEGVLAGKPQQFERQLTKQTGEVCQTLAHYVPDFERDGITVRGFVVLVLDVTEVKRKEEALRASEARLRVSLREVNDLKTAMDAHAIVAITDASGVITYANDRFCSISGYPREELIGHTHRILNSGTHPRQFFAELWKTIGAGRIWHGEICNRTKAGELYWVDATIVPFLGEDGRPVQYIAIRTDITERKHLEERLAVARDEALEASRLKSEFLATMSHEIRTPMNAIIGMASLLSDGRLEVEQADMVRVITSAAESLLTIINDILDFSRIESGQLRLDLADFDLDSVLEEVVALLAPRAHEKGLELSYEFEPAPDCLLLGDAGRVRQVVMNLVGNAVKFTDTGEVAVAASVLRQDGERLRIRLTVRDTGVGIPPEARERLFNPFAQVDATATRRFGGTGLGLAITRQLVARMGGEVGFESEPGHGSLFWVELEFPRRGPIEPQRLPALSGCRVLVVDDNDTSRAILVRQLQRAGVATEAYGDAPTALKRLRDATAPACDAAVIDWHMPGMTGLDLARAIREESGKAALPIIMLASAALRSEAISAAGIGVATLLTKPVTGSRLARSLAGTLSAPAHQPAAAPVEYAAAKDGALHVLVVEDNLANQQVASMLLDSLGHKAVVASNGHQALERLAHREFDAVLMDCQMPLLDGYETTRWIRSGKVAGVNVRIPVIALTAYAREEDRQRCLDAGMNDYVAKPIRIAELKAALLRAVANAPADVAPVPPPLDEILDVSVVRTTVALPGMSGASLLPEIVALYTSEERARLERIERLMMAHAADAAAELHAFGGNAAAFGGIEVRRLALAMEVAVRAGEWTTTTQQLPQLRAASERLRAAVQQFIPPSHESTRH